MSRPSRNIDQLLIATGIKILPQTGVSQLNIRDVVKQAGVNLGMFHYHFKTKDNFARIILQEIYERMFANLEHAMGDETEPVEKLRAIFGSLGRFARDNRQVLLSIVMDLKSGEAIAEEFVLKNFPRHFALIKTEIAKAQASGAIIDLPLPRILCFLASSTALPALIATVLSHVEKIQVPQFSLMLEHDFLSDDAIDQRVNMALKGVTP